MTREQAEAIMSALVGFDRHFETVDLAIDGLEEGDEKLALRRALGDLMGLAYVDLMRPIELRFPDLNPDRD